MKDTINTAGLLLVIIMAICCPAYGEINVQSYQTGFVFICKDSQSDCRKITMEKTNETLFIDNTLALTIEDIVSAETHVFDPINWQLDDETSKFIKFSSKPAVIVSVHLSKEGKAKLSTLTSKNIGKRLGLLIEGKLILAPEIQEHVTSTPLQIWFKDFTGKEVNDLVQQMNDAKNKYNKSVQ